MFVNWNSFLVAVQSNIALIETKDPLRSTELENRNGSQVL